MRGRGRRGDMPPFLQNGFRPFFLGAAIWLPVALAIWLLELAGSLSVASPRSALAWHVHEALFGGVGAILAGFLLTAIPNWTGRLPVSGWPLFWLFLLWAAARLAALMTHDGLRYLAAVLDVGFLFLLLGLTLREIRFGQNWRNLPVVGMLALFATGGLLSQLESLAFAATGELGWRLGLAAVLMLIALIGGRIVPSFTRNWLVRNGITSLPAAFSTFDRFGLGFWAATLAAWVSGLAERVLGILFLASGVLHLARLARWQGHRTLAEPLVTVLHAGYAWLGISALVYGFALLGWGLDPVTALHGFTAGTIGTMTLAVMTRASLGHTGRPLTADRVTIAIYILVSVGAGLRMLVPVLPLAELSTLALAGGCWGGAYALFFMRYAPILLQAKNVAGGSSPPGAVSVRTPSP